MQSQLNLIHKILALSIKINHTKKKIVWVDIDGHWSSFNVRYCGVPYTKKMEYDETVYLDRSPIEYFEEMYNHLEDVYEELTEVSYAE